MQTRKRGRHRRSAKRPNPHYSPGSSLPNHQQLRTVLNKPLRIGIKQKLQPLSSTASQLRTTTLSGSSQLEKGSLEETTCKSRHRFLLVNGCFANEEGEWLFVAEFFTDLVNNACICSLMLWEDASTDLSILNKVLRCHSHGTQMIEDTSALPPFIKEVRGSRVTSAHQVAQHAMPLAPQLARMDAQSKQRHS